MSTNIATMAIMLTSQPPAANWCESLVRVFILHPLSLKGLWCPDEKLKSTEAPPAHDFDHFKTNSFFAHSPRAFSSGALPSQYLMHSLKYFKYSLAGSPLASTFLTLLDEYTRECLSITVARRITAQDVIYQLGELFLERGIPEHIRSDNGPEFTARAVRQWLRDLGVLIFSKEWTK
jgi:transposase InsO family protein